MIPSSFSQLLEQYSKASQSGLRESLQKEILLELYENQLLVPTNDHPKFDAKNPASALLKDLNWEPFLVEDTQSKKFLAAFSTKDKIKDFQKKSQSSFSIENCVELDFKILIQLALLLDLPFLVDPLSDPSFFFSQKSCLTLQQKNLRLPSSFILSQRRTSQTQTSRKVSQRRIPLPFPTENKEVQFFYLPDEPLPFSEDHRKDWFAFFKNFKKIIKQVAFGVFEFGLEGKDTEGIILVSLVDPSSPPQVLTQKPDLLEEFQRLENSFQRKMEETGIDIKLMILPQKTQKKLWQSIPKENRAFWGS